MFFVKFGGMYLTKENKFIGLGKKRMPTNLKFFETEQQAKQELSKFSWLNQEMLEEIEILSTKRKTRKTAEERPEQAKLF